MLLVEHGKVCRHCFKKSSTTGSKRKGKGGTAAVVACPLEPFKRRSSREVKLPSKASSCGSTAAAASTPFSCEAAAAAVVKLENDDGAEIAALAVKCEALQQFACGSAAMESVADAPSEGHGVPAGKDDGSEQHHHSKRRRRVQFKGNA